MKFNPVLHKLSNGIPVLLDPMDLETTNVKILFRTGARDEAPNEHGLTHFCEHMLCKGTARFPLQKSVDDYMDYNGGAKNASTGNSMISFYGRILAENVNVLIDVLGDQLQNSLFDTKQIEIERRVISDEIRRTLDSPARQLTHFISNTLLGGASASGIRTLGTNETIAAFTREQMLEFLARRLSAKNCIIGISGKINDADDVLKCLEKTFSFLPDMDVSENMDIKYTPAIAHNPLMDKNNVKLRILFPDIWPIEYENRYKNICVGKFERYMIQELNQVLRRENGLVYGFGGTDAGNEKFGMSGFATETGPENVARVVALIARNAYRIYTENKITDDDLIRFECKNKLGDADWLESAGRRCDKLISFYRAYGRVYDFYDTVKISNGIKRDDVIKYSRGYFDGPMSIITQGADFDADLGAIWRENFQA